MPIGREPHRSVAALRRLGMPLRILIGIVCVLGGVLGFLPILGFWMVPIGLALLSVDFPPVRRLWRRLQLFYGRRIRPVFRRRKRPEETDGVGPGV